MSKPTLSYYSVRALAEPIRKLLFDANVGYENKHLGIPGYFDVPEPMKALKLSGILDYGCVPLWEEEGLQLVQSTSIARYLGRKYGYLGENEIEVAKIDSVIEGCKDVYLLLLKLAFTPEDQKVQFWKGLQTVDIPKWLGFFENILKKNGSGFVVGNKISVADFYLSNIIEEIKEIGIPLEKYSLLSSHLLSINSRPNVQKYVSDPSRPFPTFGIFLPKSC